MIKRICFWIVLFNTTATWAQNFGDYRTADGAFGYWSDLTSWEYYNGTDWVTPTATEGYPGENVVPNQVEMFTGTFIELDVSVTIGAMYSDGEFTTTYDEITLTIQGTLDVTGGNFSFNSQAGNLIVEGPAYNNGFFLLDNFEGTSTFEASFINSIGAIWSSNLPTESLVFQGGIQNLGEFSVGGVTFNENNQSISGNTEILINGDLVVDGISLTISNSSNLTVIGTTTLSTSGGLTESNGNGITRFHGQLLVNAGTTFTSTAVSISANMLFQNGITNNGTFAAGGATFNTENQTITGTSALSFANNVIINATTLTVSNSGNLTVTGMTTLNTSGGLVDTDNSGTTTLVGQLTVNAGTTFTTTAVSTSGRLVFRGGILNHGTFSAGGATFNTNNQSIAGTAAISFANAVVVNNVTVTNNNAVAVSISQTGPAALTGISSGTWTQGINSTLNYSGTTISNITLNASSAGNTVNYNNALADQIIYNPNSSTYTNLTLSGSSNRTKTLSAITTVSGNLSIQDEAIFSVSTFALSVAGNWSNSSMSMDPFIEGIQTVTFNGTSPQFISNSGDAEGTVFNNVTFNNTAGIIPQITLSATAVIANTLSMTAGVINLSGTTLTIGNAAISPGSLAHSQTSSAGWFYGGNVTRYFNTGPITELSNIGFFPLGNATDFRPFFLSATGITSGGTITLTHSLASDIAEVSIDDENPSATITQQYQASWTVSAIGVDGGTYNVIAGGTGFGTIGSLSSVRLSRAASVVGNHIEATTVSTTEPRAQRSGLTIAELTGGALFLGLADTPLPVELVSFSVAGSSNGVKLKWTTASEFNNHSFEVQRSPTGEDFQTINTLAGQGTKISSTQYEFEDWLALPGKSYYRLKQVDFDGTVSFSAIRMAEFDKSIQLEVFPTVSENRKIQVHLYTDQPNSAVPIRIISDKGMPVMSITYQTDHTGLLDKTLELDQLSGVYLLIISTETSLVRKIILK